MFNLKKQVEEWNVCEYMKTELEYALNSWQGLPLGQDKSFLHR